MFAALGIDPGGTTGWAVVYSQDDSMLNEGDLTSGLEFEYGQITGSPNAQAQRLLRIANEFSGLPIIMEDFQLRQKNVELSPVEIASRVEFALYISNQSHRYFKQSPSDAKKTCSDKRLKQWGLWLPHKERHARDGIRHALLFLRRCQSDPSLRENAYGR